MKLFATLAFATLAQLAQAETPSGHFRHCTFPMSKALAAECTALVKIYQNQMAACLKQKGAVSSTDPNTGSHHVYKARYLMCRREVAILHGVTKP